MTNHARFRPAARRDIIDHVEYIARFSEATALRFKVAAEQTCSYLAARPEMAGRYEFERPDLAEVRAWRVKGFEKYVIFYVARSDGIEVLRILFGGRNIESVFEE